MERDDNVVRAWNLMESIRTCMLITWDGHAQRARPMAATVKPAEHAICHIEGAVLIPMRTVPEHLRELEDTGERIVVFCHHGVRSLSVADWLRRQGLENCQSMTGGIDLWSERIDPRVPRY